MKFSIIIPVYNVKDYLKQCLESILNQTYTDYEIIIVDDGSEDGSEVICDEYAKNNNIMCIHQINQGLSVARNVGIGYARGEYLLFIDSDDYLLDNQALFRLSKKSDGCDIVTFFWSEISDDKTKKYIHDCEMYKYDWNASYDNGRVYLLDALRKSRLMPWYACMRIYRKEFWLKEGFRFPKDIKYEDAYLIPKVLFLAKNINVENTLIYGYRVQRQGAISAVKSLNLQSEKNKLTVMKNNIEWISNLNNINDELKTRMLYNFSSLYYGALINATAVKKADRNILWKLLKREKWICQYSIYGKERLVAIAIKLFGVKFVGWILGIRRRKRYGI